MAFRAKAVAWSPALLLGLAMALGGGSALFPLPRMIVELAAVPVLLIAVRRLRLRSFGWPAIVPLVLLGLLVLLFAAQLVPLPASVWMALPGRALAADTARQLGWAHRAMPLSLDPEATVRAGLTLIPGIALFLAALTGDDRDRRRMLLVIVVMAAASLALSMLQALSGWNAAFYVYDSAHRGLPTGLFANRNHQACLLAIAPLAIAASMRPDHGAHRTTMLAGAGVLALFCVLGVLATGSRSGTALAMPVVVAVVLMAVRSTRWRKLALAALAACVLVLLAVTIGGGTLLHRFGQMQDQRFGFWPDVLAAIRLYFPLGSGFGTFEPVFAAAERLAIVGPHYLNHAHNDYLEIALEGGVAAICLLAAFFAWLLALGLRIWRSDPASPGCGQARCVWIGLLAILLHAGVDYPLRTLAIQAVFAVFGAILTRAGEHSRTSLMTSQHIVLKEKTLTSQLCRPMQRMLFPRKTMRIGFGTAAIGALVLLAGCASTTKVQTGAVPAPVADGFMVVDPLAVYRIGPLDVLSVTVFKEPDLTVPQVQVDSGGTFEMPLLGTVTASGKTAAQLSGELRRALGDRYLVSPNVVVNVSAVNSQKVTIEGAVTAPGVFLLQGETTLEGVVALAKGPSRTAKLDQVAIFRKTGGQRTVAVFDLQAIREGRAADPVIVAGDVVVVGFSGMAQVMQDLLRAVPAIAVFSTF